MAANSNINANGNIRIVVLNLSGIPQPIYISPEATIFDLKKKILEKGIIDHAFPENLVLFKHSTRNNMTVDEFDKPDMTIADCEINSGDEVHAVIRDINYVRPELTLRRQNARNPNPPINYNRPYNGPQLGLVFGRQGLGGKRSRRNRKTRSRRNRKTRSHKH
jgi:hypothetical protein